MAKDPAFLFYSQDFIVGVQTMNFEDRGKYITILAQMHQQGRMKEETIRFLVGSVSDTLRLKFLIDENGFWHNERLEQETERRKIFTESRRNNGLKGGRPQKGKKNKKPNENLVDNHMGNHMEDVNENENETKNKKEAIVKIEPIYKKINSKLILTEDEFEKLMLHYSKDEIDNVLERIENYADNKKYKSLYLTAKNWLKLDLDRKLNGTQNTKTTGFKKEHEQRIDEVREFGKVTSGILGNTGW